MLTELLDKRGPSSETYGILGRIYKDRWESADKTGDGSARVAYWTRQSELICVGSKPTGGTPIRA